jgi:uncharacterized surface protein with fasciclin (FAS1) repeats
MKNVAEIVGTDKFLTTMNRGIVASDLTEKLSHTGPFTIFAPSEIAFGKLDSGVFLNLEKPENKMEMADLLNHHIVLGKISYKDFKDGQQLKTLNGQELYVTVTNESVSINGSRVQARDMEGWNGVVHSLEKVIILPENT